MTRRLFYLNALLLLGIIALALRLRSLWDDARQREEMVRLNEIQRPVYHPRPPAPQVQALNTATYSDVAMRMLFSRDRNPTVIIEVPPPPAEPVPPPFPKSNGVMLLGDPRVILTARAGDGQKIYKAGDKVGDYEIVAFDSKTIQFKWHDKEFKKDLADLVDNNPIGPPTNTGAPPPAAASGAATVKGADTANAPPAADPNAGATRICDPGDSTPAGTVKDGMRKVVSVTPFGSGCRWVPSK
jgi:hypothetical protein